MTKEERRVHAVVEAHEQLLAEKEERRKIDAALLRRASMDAEGGASNVASVFLAPAQRAQASRTQTSAEDDDDAALWPEWPRPGAFEGEWRLPEFPLPQHVEPVDPTSSPRRAAPRPKRKSPVSEAQTPAARGDGFVVRPSAAAKEAAIAELAKPLARNAADEPMLVLRPAAGDESTLRAFADSEPVKERLRQIWSRYSDGVLAASICTRSVPRVDKTFRPKFSEVRSMYLEALRRRFLPPLVVCGTGGGKGASQVPTPGDADASPVSLPVEAGSATDNIKQFGEAWTHKHRPLEAAQVCGNQPQVAALHSWLSSYRAAMAAGDDSLLGSATSSSTRAAAQAYAAEDSDSNYEDCGDSGSDSDGGGGRNRSQVADAFCLVGDVGAGKTASVHACAHQLGFFVIEVNAASLRNAQSIFARVGEATQSRRMATGTVTGFDALMAAAGDSDARDASGLGGAQSRQVIVVDSDCESSDAEEAAPTRAGRGARGRRGRGAGGAGRGAGSGRKRAQRGGNGARAVKRAAARSPASPAKRGKSAASTPLMGFFGAGPRKGAQGGAGAPSGAAGPSAAAVKSKPKVSTPSVAAATPPTRGLASISRQLGTPSSLMGASSQSRATSSGFSIVLFEEIDIVFDADEGFARALCNIIATAKCPIVMTCNSVPKALRDARRAGLEIITETFHRPALNRSLMFLEVLCLAEGVRATTDEIGRVLQLCRGDLRRALSLLQFWCNRLPVAPGGAAGGAGSSKDQADGARSTPPRAAAPPASQDSGTEAVATAATPSSVASAGPSPAKSDRAKGGKAKKAAAKGPTRRRSARLRQVEALKNAGLSEDTKMTVVDVASPAVGAQAKGKEKPRGPAFSMLLVATDVSLPRASTDQELFGRASGIAPWRVTSDVRQLSALSLQAAATVCAAAHLQCGLPVASTFGYRFAASHTPVSPPKARGPLSRPWGTWLWPEVSVSKDGCTEPNVLDVMGGTARIFGVGFARTSARGGRCSVAVFVGGTQCENVRVESDSEIVVEVPRVDRCVTRVTGTTAAKMRWLAAVEVVLDGSFSSNASVPRGAPVPFVKFRVFSTKVPVPASSEELAATAAGEAQLESSGESSIEEDGEARSAEAAAAKAARKAAKAAAKAIEASVVSSAGAGASADAAVDAPKGATQPDIRDDPQQLASLDRACLHSDDDAGLSAAAELSAALSDADLFSRLRLHTCGGPLVASQRQVAHAVVKQPGSDHGESAYIGSMDCEQDEYDNALLGFGSCTDALEVAHATSGTVTALALRAMAQSFGTASDTEPAADADAEREAWEMRDLPRQQSAKASVLAAALQSRLKPNSRGASSRLLRAHDHRLHTLQRIAHIDEDQAAARRNSMGRGSRTQRATWFEAQAWKVMAVPDTVLPKLLLESSSFGAAAAARAAAAGAAAPCR